MSLRKSFLFPALFSFITSNAAAQNDTVATSKPELTFSGFADVYYAFDFNKPGGEFRQPFLYSHNRHNEFNLNLGFIKVAVVHEKYRANLALQAGTYPNDNYAAEPGVLKNLFEANAGVSLSSKNNLWLDAGIFGSHIGFESAVSSDNWTLTRSLAAEGSPYFLSGAKITYQPNRQWTLVGLVCNGWQRIRRVSGNSLLSFGTQVTYAKNENAALNWSTFVGTDDPDSVRRARIFNNFYGKFQLSSKLGLIAGFDIGLQQASKDSKTYQKWMAPVIIARYALNGQWATAIRMEYFADKHQVIMPSWAAEGFHTSGASANIDFTPFPNISCRLEGRLLKSKDEIFNKQGQSSATNAFIVSSIAVKF